MYKSDHCIYISADGNEFNQNQLLVKNSSLKILSADCQSSVGQQSAICWPTVSCLLANNFLCIWGQRDGQQSATVSDLLVTRILACDTRVNSRVENSFIDFLYLQAKLDTWPANVTILLFTQTFATWYFCFPCKGIQHYPLVFLKT